MLPPTSWQAADDRITRYAPDGCADVSDSIQCRVDTIPFGGLSCARGRETLMRYAEITGWGKALPPAVLSNADLEKIVDTNDEWITSRSGIKERRISHVPATDMAEIAARRAMDVAGIDASDVDLIVNATCTPESIIPASASYVQAKLGASKAGAMDVNANCSGFIYGYVTVDSMVRSGAVDTVLLIGVERMSWVVDYTDRGTCILFGDGAGAVVVQASETPTGIMASDLGVDGTMADILVCAERRHHQARIGNLCHQNPDGRRGRVSPCRDGHGRCFRGCCEQSRVGSGRDRSPRAASSQSAHHRRDGSPPQA